MSIGLAGLGLVVSHPLCVHELEKTSSRSRRLRISTEGFVCTDSLMMALDAEIYTEFTIYASIFSQNPWNNGL